MRTYVYYIYSLTELHCEELVFKRNCSQILDYLEKCRGIGDFLACKLVSRIFLKSKSRLVVIYKAWTLNHSNQSKLG